MKNKKFIGLVLCLAVLSVLFTGCSFKSDAFLEPENAIKAPLMTGAYIGIQEALEKSVGNDISLKYVTYGENRVAICGKDIDHTGKETVFAFYQKNTKASVPRINVLKLVDSEWVSVQDIEPVGNDILEISFADIDNDGVDEVITGWSVFNTKQSQLCVYKNENGSFVKRASESYSDFAVCDIDDDNRQEIGIVLIDSVEKTSKVSFFGMNDNKFDLRYSIPVDGNVTNYVNMVAGKLKNGKTAVFIDGYKTQTSMITELVYFEEGKLVDPFYNEKSKVNNETLRYCTLETTDIDKDGYPEIPKSVPVNGKSTAIEEGKQYFIKWINFNNGSEETVMSAWYNPELTYYIKLSDEWVKNTSVIYDDTTKTVTFAVWDTAKKTATDELLKVKTFDVNAWTENNEGYFVLNKTSENVVGGLVPKTALNTGFYIPQDGIKQMFFINN